MSGEISVPASETATHNSSTITRNSVLGTRYSELVTYSRWDGSQAGLLPDAATLLAELAGDLAAGRALGEALARLARRGLAELPGLVDLLAQARAALEAARLALGELDLEIDGGPAEQAALAARVDALEALVAQLVAAHLAGDPGPVDADSLAAELGASAAANLEALRQVATILTEAGYLQAVDGRWQLTGQAARQLGQLALRDLYARLRPDRAGRHQGGRAGAGSEPSDDRKVYAWGDPFVLDLPATLGRAILRHGPGTPVRLSASDFTVHRPEPRVGVATALLLDVSRSMLLRDCFVAAKQVALALHALVETRFPGDQLSILAFAHGARLVEPALLPQLTIDEREFGTNLQAALRLARIVLRRHRPHNRQIILITDGEPTAHLRDEGGVFFAYPPTARTIEASLREVVACTRERIVINTFMLERGQHMGAFVDRLTRLNSGRGFFVTPERLGEYVLIDYAGGRRSLR